MSIVRGLPTTLDPELIANGAGRFSYGVKGEALASLGRYRRGRDPQSLKDSR